jgi:ABC-2 type transport system permease protein
LFFLAAIYASTGIFASSLTDNQIVAFIVSVLLSALFFIGFDLISSLAGSSSVAQIISSIGINEHYKSISRGVLDSGDIVYFIGIAAIFLLLARTVLQSRKW